MLFTTNLEETIFTMHNNFNADELIVLSGYLGPSPILRLNTLPLKSKIIYGMYGSDGIGATLHKSLQTIQREASVDLNIFYSKIPVHSKCYLWKREGVVVHALIGSANFSVNGLTTPLRESLAEVPSDIYIPLNDYVNFVINNSAPCLDVTTVNRSRTVSRIISTEKCLLSLLMRNGAIHNAAGLNWGQNPENHTNPNDAYIPISTEHIRAFPLLFPPKQLISSMSGGEGRQQRHNDSIDIIWDDGTTMRGLLEGSVIVDGVLSPKQISSFPVKSELGLYLRTRLGVAPGQAVTKQDLENYGRTDIEIKLLEEGLYSFDFSRPIESGSN